MPALPFEPRPVVLQGRHVRLEPLHEAHAAGLLAAAEDDPSWAYMPSPRPRSIDDALAMIREAAAETESGHEVAFAIVPAGSEAAAGSTRYLDVQRRHRALEIGWTWIGPAWQRTPVNTECKLLLLSHAFAELGAHRVTLKTDARNLRSQRAIERLGAIREGVLRRHRVCWDGHVRDTVYYGITDDEWPSVRSRLQALLATR
jgi:RimJ/RimL family protein N-acetyltransferase